MSAIRGTICRSEATTLETPHQAKAGVLGGAGAEPPRNSGPIDARPCPGSIEHLNKHSQTGGPRREPKSITRHKYRQAKATTPSLHSK